MDSEKGIPSGRSDAVVSSNRCLGCNCGMTLVNASIQYNRALKRGLSPEEAKASCPRCQKCMTKYLRERAG